MAILSTLALRPDTFSSFDLPDTYVAEGEKFVAFGPDLTRLLQVSIPSRRHIHPDNLHFNAYPDFTTPQGPHEAFMVLDNLGDGDYTKDPIEFVLNNCEDADYDSLGGDGYRIRADWRQRFVDLQTKVLECCQKILKQYPSEGIEDEGRFLLQPLSGEGCFLLQPLQDDDWLDLLRVHESYEEVADAIYNLKMTARNNIGALNYLIHSQPSWWRRALQESEASFVDSLALPERPKRGCFINLLSDWSYVNLSFLMRCNVPFAYVWSEAVNSQPRFDRLDAAVLTGYYWLRLNLEKEPAPSEIPAIAGGKRSATKFDHLLQDKRARTRGSPQALYDSGKTYVAQYHEGWRGVGLRDPETIQNALDRYEWYEKDIGDGKQYVVIEAWSMRGAEDDSVRATYEFGPVATQSKDAERLGEKVDLTVDERREMYKMRCAPWGGGRYDPITGKLLQAVPLDRQSALIDLERLFYPRTPVLEHSRPPPSVDQHRGDEESTPYLLTRMSEATGKEEESVSTSSAASLIRRMGGFARERADSPPTTHSSWRTETDSDLPFSESMGRHRSASPRRGIRVPNAPPGLVVPDPLRIVREDAATPGSPLFQQRYALLRSAIPSLLQSLSSRPYPRADYDFFQVKWTWDFQRNGYLRFPNEADRLRVYLWLETQSVELPEAARELVGPEPDHYNGDYLQFKDGGGELYEDYKSMVQDLCRREHATSFLYYGGFVSAIAAKYGEHQLKDRIGTGVHLATRLYKSGRVHHPYGLSKEIVVEKPTQKEVNKLLGLVVGRDGKKLHSLFPPADLWAEFWPGNGEWNHEEENYFLDIVNGLENNTRTALSKSRWIKQLSGLRNSILRDHADRNQAAMSLGTARAWVRLFDWAYEVEDGTMKIARWGPDYRAKRLPLFR
ncbi:hypothetical protein GGF50DRAFT_121446 [Schizophyllum commune]